MFQIKLHKVLKQFVKFQIAENVAEASYVVVDAVKAEIEDVLNSISDSRLDLREDQNNS